MPGEDSDFEYAQCAIKIPIHPIRTMRSLLAVFLLILSTCVSTRIDIPSAVVPTSPPAGSRHTNLPEKIDPTGRYLFYIHGKLIEDQGTVDAVSPAFGPYEYTEILDYLTGAGFTVISEARTAPTDGVAYAQEIGAQIEALLEAGVPPANITVMGFSKGGGIAILTSAWLPRLPGQPIFYPVTNEAYAVEIASRWNVKDSGVGYVTKFEVKKSFMDRYPVQQVGAGYHSEWWIPAEDLEDLNRNIVGVIEVIGEYTKAEKRGGDKK